MNRDIYQTITDRFIEKLKQGTVPWQQPWISSVQNIISRKAYRGINAFTLGMTDRTSPFWLTFKQALDLGGHVKKGEKSLPVIYYKILEKRDDAGNLIVREDGRPARVPLVRWANVFNLDQTEGIEAPKIETVQSHAHPAFVAGLPSLPESVLTSDRTACRRCGRRQSERQQMGSARELDPAGSTDRLTFDLNPIDQMPDKGRHFHTPSVAVVMNKSKPSCRRSSKTSGVRWERKFWPTSSSIADRNRKWRRRPNARTRDCLRNRSPFVSGVLRTTHSASIVLCQHRLPLTTGRPIPPQLILLYDCPYHSCHILRL